tara:strand:+ start:822 stop:4013 length:3192 start_codon:yes stop_codon:yes gene_type:complete
MATSSGTLGLVIHGGVEFTGEEKLLPLGTNREFGYWRSSKHNSLTTQFNKINYPFEGSGITEGAARVYNTAWQSGNSVGPEYSTVTGGVGSWFKAGELRSRYGDDGIQERSLYLSKGGHINAGSGINTTRGFSVYAKITPSGDLSGSVLVGQHNTDPATIVLGCDYNAKFYVRADASVSGGINVPYYATATKPFTDYDYPAQVVGVYTSGDARLKIYVNGKEEGVSAPFVRNLNLMKVTNALVGKREYPIDEGHYTGWIDEVGLGDEPLTPSGIKDLYDDRFKLSRWVDSEHAPQGFGTSTTALSTGTITKCGCSGNLPNKMTAEITGITLPELGTDKGAVGQKVTLTYDAAATYTDSGTTTYTGIWDSGAVSLDCGVGTVRLRLYCGASDQFYMAHSFSWMVDGEEVRGAQTCSPVNITFALAGATSGGGACCSDDAAAEIAVTVTAAIVTTTTNTPSEFVGTGFGTGFSAANKDYIEFVVESGSIMGIPAGFGPLKGGAYDKTLWGAKDDIAATASLTFGDTEFDDVNDGTITLIDVAGTSITYKIKNDYSAAGYTTEFNAGGSRGAAAENFAQVVEHLYGHYGTIHVTDSSRVRFTEGGYDFSDGTVVLIQGTAGVAGNTTITTAASFDNCTDTNAPAAFSGGGDKNNVISTYVGLPLGEPPVNFRQLHKFEVDAYVEHAGNHHSGVLLSVGLQKKPQTEANKDLTDIGWTSDKMNVPSGDIRKVTFSGVVPGYLLHHEGSDSFRDDLLEHELKFFLEYPISSLPYDSEFKIYSTKVRYEGFEDVLSTDTTLDFVTTGGISASASGTVDLFLKSDPAVSTLPLFLRSKDGLTGLGEAGDSLMTGSATVGTNSFMNLYVLGAIEIATMNLFTKSDAPSSFTKIGRSDLFTQGGKDVLPSKFNNITLFIKDLVSGSGTPNSTMNLAMPNVGLATIEDRRLLFTKGFVPETFNSSTLYVQVPEQAIKTLELKLQGPPYYTPSGIMNLFLQVHQPTFSAQGRLGRKLEGRDNYGLEPAILQNKNISLVTSGHAPLNANMNLAMPNVMASGTNTKLLYISGKPSG